MRSNGRGGEEAARYYFRRHGWEMEKMESPAKNLGPVFGKPGQFRAVYTEGGVPDFIGFRMNDPKLGRHWSNLIPTYCEVKEAHGDTWPASKLTPEQRAFMAALPVGTAFVFLLWNDGGAGEMHTFIPRGSYKRGQGMK